MMLLTILAFAHLPQGLARPSYLSCATTRTVGSFITSSMGTSARLAQAPTSGQCDIVTSSLSGGYVAGQTYSFSLSSDISRGLKMQASAGSFTSGGSGTTTCRYNNNPISSVTYSWAAPASGTGTITFQALCGRSSGIYITTTTISEAVIVTSAPTATPTNKPFNGQPDGKSCYAKPDGKSCYTKPDGKSCYLKPDGKSSYVKSSYDKPDSKCCYVKPDGKSCYIKPDGKSCYVESDGKSCYDKPDGKDCYVKPDGKSCYAKPDGKSCYVKPDGKWCYAKPDGKSCYAKPDGKSCYVKPDGKWRYVKPYGKSCYAKVILQNPTANPVTLSPTANPIVPSPTVNPVTPSPNVQTAATLSPTASNRLCVVNGALEEVKPGCTFSGSANDFRVEWAVRMR
ncbi:hypothetical protein AAMO2058_000680200 [Amorphochlora amoebiformis]